MEVSVPAARFGSPEALLKEKLQGKAPAAGHGPAASSAGSAANKDGRKRLSPGEMLFAQGDPGGDLYFIEEGIIEIFQGKDGEAIHLADMTSGEIIGVMTCLTSEPRMASARAKTPVICKKVPHDSIRKVLAALPNWLKIVLKEFTMRLSHMNRLYGESIAKIKDLEAKQINNVYLGSLIASAFSQVAEFMAIKFEDTKMAVVDDVVQRLELVLSIPKEQLEKIFAVLNDAGLIKIEIEPEKKRTVTKLESAQKLAYFAQFVKESKHGPTKKLLKAKFTNRETRVLSAMVKYAARLEMDLSKVCRLKIQDLETSLERTTGVKFERDTLQKGVDLKLLTIEGAEGDESVVTRPVQLGRTIACVEAIRRLETLKLKEEKT